jgi:hypothetical protein
MAMPFFLKDLRNRLKTTDEPEQLDLFGHPSHEPVPTIGHTISPSVGYKIACAACSHHGLGAQYVSLIRNTIAHQSWANLSPEWHDYVVGLGSTMSFWPTSMQSTFHSSDRAALASDWASVQSDLNLAWQAITTAERICNEQRERERRETQTAE